ncbi:MAG: hypothetical protein KGY45_03005 [Hadesarchaea archaeon]|nr:hypothetical protein [Hadesarchaea archaeon]
MQIKVKAKIHPTEDLDKIKNAVNNLFPKIEFEENNDYLVGKSSNPEDLEKLKNQLGLQAIRDSARRVLQRGKENNSLRFEINRQAATVTKVSFTEGETPLGPIEVEIQSKDIQLLIDYLAPKTHEGNAVKKVKLEELKSV